MPIDPIISTALAPIRSWPVELAPGLAWGPWPFAVEIDGQAYTVEGIEASDLIVVDDKGAVITTGTAAVTGGNGSAQALTLSMTPAQTEALRPHLPQRCKTHRPGLRLQVRLFGDDGRGYLLIDSDITLVATGAIEP